MPDRFRVDLVTRHYGRLGPHDCVASSLATAKSSVLDVPASLIELAGDKVDLFIRDNSHAPPLDGAR